MPIRLLLVEDDEGEALHVRKLLDKATTDFEVTHVVSLRAALQVLSVQHADLVLLDLSLPDSHGFETVTTFARESDVPFIVLTGNEDTELAMRTIGLGAQDYQLKSGIQSSSLERTIMVAIGKASASEARQRRSFDTLTQLLPPETANVAMLAPRVETLVETIEDLEAFLRNNAPGLMADVGSLMDKHKASQTIREIRSILRLEQEPSGRRRSVSDVALKALGDVSRQSQPPANWDEAEATLDAIAAKDEATL